jgi:rare lipoprotein A
MIAAHKTLRFGTHVRVTDRDNGRFVIVTIVDSGPFIRGRVMDASASAVDELGSGRQGGSRKRCAGGTGCS